MLSKRKIETVEITGKPLKTYKKGRMCKYQGCQVELNSYNGDKVCGPHRREILFYSKKELYHLIKEKQ